MPSNNLPSQPTAFIGRKKELAEIAVLLADPHCRLVAVVGVGGIGKTRLALQVADDQQPHFTDGIVFVPLAPVGSPELIPSAIAGALDISFYGSEEPRTQLLRYFHEKQMLLVMDNFEHLLEGVDLLSDLLQAAPHLKILVTSRSRLNLQEEWLFSLDGLSFPGESSTDALESYSAVQLFVQRARQVSSPFTLKDNAAAVRAICRQVEGMPLALELAATWLRAMSCQQVVEQMARNLDFLTTSLRNVPERHRSLRLVFDQSWQMLSDEEQSVLMNLSVFRGSFDLEAAQYVAQASPAILVSLVDQSLIRLDKTGRYDLHELLRQYAADQLAAANLATPTMQQHIDHFLKLAEQMEAHLFGQEQIMWFDRLEVDMDNLRAALARSVESEVGLQLAAALGWFFSERSYWNEGLTWLSQALAANPDAPASLRAKALHNIGALYGQIGDDLGVRTNCNQSIVIARTICDDWNLAWGLSQLGQYTYSDVHESISKLEESIVLFRNIDDKMGLTHTLVRLCWKKLWLNNDILSACTILDEAASLASAVGDVIMLGWITHTHGNMARICCDFKASVSHFETAIDYFQRARFPNGVHFSFLGLAKTALGMGDIARSLNLYKEAASLNELSLGSNIRTDTILDGLANIAMKQGQFKRAAILFSAGNEIFVKWSNISPEINPFLKAIPALRAKLGEETFTEAWEAGTAMTWTQALVYGFEDDIRTPENPIIRTSADTLLTEREIEILQLMSDGLNSTEIANRLILSVGTIRWYLKEIYSKLDVHSRSEAIARARTLAVFKSD